MKKLLSIVFLLQLFFAQLLGAEGNDIPYFKSKGILESKQVKDNNQFTQFDIVIDETDPRTKDINSPVLIILNESQYRVIAASKATPGNAIKCFEVNGEIGQH